MRNEPYPLKLQSGKIVLSTVKAVGNATIPVSATPFPLRDTIYYQIDKHGDYTQGS